MMTCPVTLLTILAMAATADGAPKTRHSETTTSVSKDQPETRARTWWLEWQRKHPKAANLTWEDLGEEDKEEAASRAEEARCSADPKCMEVPRGGHRLLPGEGVWEEAEKADAEKAAEDARCAADPKCGAEQIARVLCENISKQAAVRTEIKCRHQVLDAGLLATPALRRRAQTNSVCPEDRSDFSEYDSFGELNALVDEFETEITEQKARYKEIARKAFSPKVCRHL